MADGRMPAALASGGPEAAAGRMQQRFDAAVVIPTVLRASLLRAVRSVFAQTHPGRIQILIGVDVARGDRDMLRILAAECPQRMAVTVLDPGYSTAQVHGGIYPCAFGGSTRTVLSYAANSARIAYLDDDNWYAPNHIGDLLAAIDGFDWAFTYRWFADPDTQSVLCVDDFESVGPGRGIYREKLNGFVDTNCLMIDKTRCHWVLPFWSIPLLADGTGSDRTVFNALREKHSVAWSGRPSIYYALNPEAGPQPAREKIFAARGIKAPHKPKSHAKTLVHRDSRINEYLLSTVIRKLYFGAGQKALPGWLNAAQFPHAPDILPIDCRQPLPFSDETFDYIAADHIVETLSLGHTVRFVGEAFRTLRRGGTLRIATPDLEKLVALYVEKPSELQRGYVNWVLRTFMRGVQGYNPALAFNNMFYNFGRRCVFDRRLLTALLEAQSFVDARLCHIGESADPHLSGIEGSGPAAGMPEFDAYESMAIEARKPAAVVPGNA